MMRRVIISMSIERKSVAQGRVSAVNMDWK
jgi:hypothetical protein